ncbi:putative glutathione S-transferase [Cinnamomum micranthum f. kanehirae]|uniref:Putative glutathione S-transferase n=1 Tax=Cinnamomum micranthum f. kanehirae TaxID=337451 RepID=A0A443NWB4_9MAGN|nr:putative glutathione S-transferase [Cinnamomum micranthum f. kanehirae]
MAANKKCIDCLKLLEGELEVKLFYGGKSLGYVDMVLVPFVYWFYTYETDDNFSIENECPKLIALAKRCVENESVSMVLPDPHKVYDFVENLKKYEIEFCRATHPGANPGMEHDSPWGAVGSHGRWDPTAPHGESCSIPGFAPG